MRMRSFLAAAVLALLSFPVFAGGFYVPTAKSPEDLDMVNVGTVAEIPKPDTIKLANGKIYHLVGIRVPVYFGQDAIDFLSSLLLNKKVALFGNRAIPEGLEDRFGNTNAHVMLEDGTWVQAALVDRGLAWVSSVETNRELIRELYAHEDAARKRKAGLWSKADYAVRDANALVSDSSVYNSFQVYRGTVLDVANYDGITFFNFGPDRKTDFTVFLPDAFLPHFKAEEKGAFKPWIWKGKEIRVRGWVEKNSGPMIGITHPEQVEILDPLPEKK
jgi:micrococcal nuclease